MKKILTVFVIFFLALFSQFANAQLKGFRIGLGLEGALPSGNFSNVYSGGGGLSARFEIRPTHNLAFNATVGGILFAPKSGNGIRTLVNIPVKIGAKYILVGHLYGMLELGNTHSLAYVYGNGSVTHTSNNSFTYAPSVGVQLIGFDIGLRYETFGPLPTNPGNNSFLGLRLGFGL
ncbi:MAG: hypothetical protein NVSMB45_00560 [Ginsengibacter sp.]